MPTIRQIRNRIRSVNKIAQVTRAYEMISASKMRRAQLAVLASRNYAEKAREASEWAKRLAEQLRSDAGLAMAYQADASVLLVTGNTKGAEDAYMKSLSFWEKAGWPFYQARALVACSQAMIQSSPDESRKRLQQAAEIFRKLGAKRDLEKTEARLSSQH